MSLAYIHLLATRQVNNCAFHLSVNANVCPAIIRLVIADCGDDIALALRGMKVRSRLMMRDIIFSMGGTYFIIVLGIVNWCERPIIRAEQFRARDRLAQINPVLIGEY